MNVLDLVLNLAAGQYSVVNVCIVCAPVDSCLPLCFPISGCKCEDIIFLFLLTSWDTPHQETDTLCCIALTAADISAVVSFEKQQLFLHNSEN